MFPSSSQPDADNFEGKRIRKDQGRISRSFNMPERETKIADQNIRIIIPDDIKTRQNEFRGSII